MTEFETVIRSELDRAVPLPIGEARDWWDVVERAGMSRPSQTAGRRAWGALSIVIAAAIVGAAFSPAGAALGRSIADFSGWVRGVPGPKADEAAQRALARDYGGWLGSTREIELTRLVTTRLGSTTFTLYGFRSGDAICLRTEAAGGASGSNVSCAPVSAVVARPEPAVVLAVDEFFEAPVADAHAAPLLYSATVGVVAKRVGGVSVQISSGVVQAAAVAHGAFLAVGPASRGNRVRAISATTVGGDRVELPFVPSEFGAATAPASPRDAPPGPTTVERPVRGGSIGWLDRREARGETVPPTFRLPRGTIMQRRLIRPAPASAEAVVVSLMGPTPPVNPLLPDEPAICFDLVGEGSGGGGGCTPPDEIFDANPFTTGEGVLEGGDQFETVFGVATDDVDRMEAFLADGRRVTVPLRDNAYLVEIARAALPIRVVAYDQENRVIGLRTLTGA